VAAAAGAAVDGLPATTTKRAASRDMADATERGIQTGKVSHA
jgi:hypothetical protein